MTHPHVLVIEHQRDAGLGQFADRLESAGVHVTVAGPERAVGVPETLAGVDGLIVLGGSMGPTDDTAAPWLPATRSLLRQGVETGTPTLGICLGAQLLATATGGQVRTMPAGPEVGLHEVSFDAAAQQDALFGDFAGTSVPVVQWHWLEAASLPQSAEVLASSTSCSNQAFRIGQCAWGVQFHPEALAETARDWAQDDAASVRELGLTEAGIVSEVRAADAVLRASWSSVADRFAALVSAA